MKSELTARSSSAALRIDVDLRDGIVILSLDGRLDNSLDEVFLRKIDAIQHEGHHRVIVDCGKLAYLNSRGVSGFISVVDELRESGGDLKLAALKPEAALVVERLGISKLIQIFETSDEAVRAFATPIEDYQSEGGLDVFVASTGGKVFHASGCASVRRLRWIKSFASKKEARESGLRPCHRCC